MAITPKSATQTHKVCAFCMRSAGGVASTVNQRGASITVPETALWPLLIKCAEVSIWTWERQGFQLTRSILYFIHPFRATATSPHIADTLLSWFLSNSIFLFLHSTHCNSHTHIQSLSTHTYQFGSVRRFWLRTTLMSWARDTCSFTVTLSVLLAAGRMRGL